MAIGPKESILVEIIHVALSISIILVGKIEWRDVPGTAKEVKRELLFRQIPSCNCVNIAPVS
jgi:hypothetical protein